MSLIRKPAELEIQPTIQALIYGQAGTGKTTLALSAPAPLLLDFDNGVSRVNPGHRTDTVQIKSYQDCLDVLQEDLSAYKSIVVDTGGKLLDFMGDWLIKKNSKLGKANGTLSLQGFGERKAEFRQLCKQLRMMNKHLIFVAHRDEQKQGDEYRYVPIFGGSSYADLVSDLDLVGYLEAYGRKRVITFDPTDRNDGKNTLNMPATTELPLVVDDQGAAMPNTFFTDVVIGGFERRLAEQKALNEAFGEIMEFVKANVEAVTDADTANEVSAKLQGLNHVGNSRIYASQMLRNRCNELGLKLNKEAKRYEAA